MISDKAKQAAQARQQLGLALQTCAEVMSQAAQAITASSVALAEAIECERWATEGYIAALEAQLSRQKELS